VKRPAGRTVYLLVILPVSFVAVFSTVRSSGDDAVTSVVQPGTVSLEAQERGVV